MVPGAPGAEFETNREIGQAFQLVGMGFVRESERTCREVGSFLAFFCSPLCAACSGFAAFIIPILERTTTLTLEHEEQT
jgi:hypothetical protein